MYNVNKFKKAIMGFTVAGLLFTNTITAYGALGDETLQLGSSSEDVKLLQEYLGDLGYFQYDGLTTYFGSITETAVKEFQAANELESNGVFDQASFKKLMDIVSKDENIKIRVNEYLTYSEDLRVTSTGQAVNNLQESLKALGYLEIDNTTFYFGPITEKALRNFQESQQLLESTGIANKATIDSLNLNLTRRGINLEGASRSSQGRNSIGTSVVNTARSLIGTPYRSGGTSPRGFDCSGFTQYVYAQNGISISRDSRSQANNGTRVSRSELQVGDLVIFSGTYRSGPSHTGIYIGNGNFIHASTNGRVVTTHSLDSAYYSRHFSYGRRVF